MKKILFKALMLAYLIVDTIKENKAKKQQEQKNDTAAPIAGAEK